MRAPAVCQAEGRLDCAVNNAGLAHETASIVDADPVKFREMLSTNVTGLFLCLQREIAAGIHWLLSGQSSFVAGAILNIDGRRSEPWSLHVSRHLRYGRPGSAPRRAHRDRLRKARRRLNIACTKEC